MIRKLILATALLAGLLPAAALADELYAMPAPCRVLDTRLAGGGGLIPQGGSRHFLVRGTPGGDQGGLAGCGIPAEATGIVVNIGIIGPSAAGWASVWTYDEEAPYVTVVTTTSGGGFAVTGGTMVWLAPAAEARAFDLTLHLYAMSGHAVVDAVGYLIAH